MKLFQYNPGVMRLPILSLRPMAVLLLAGWIISPSLATGEAGKAGSPAGSASPTKAEKGKTVKSPESGKAESASSPDNGKADGPGRTAGLPEGDVNHTTGSAGEATGPQKNAISADDADEAEEHTDNPAGDSQDAATTVAAKEDEEGDSLAGLVPSREQASRSKMNALLPPGSTHRGVYYPSFRPVRTDPDVTDPITGLTLGVDAPMASLFRGDAVTRLDDNHVLIDKASFVQYGETESGAASVPKQTLSVELEQALYDLKNDILVSHRPVRIENEQMILTGDSMVHDRVSGLTELSGGVRVILFSDNAEPEDSGSGGNPQATPPGTAGDSAAAPVAVKSDTSSPPKAAPAASSNPSAALRPVPSKKPKSRAAEPSSRK